MNDSTNYSYHEASAKRKKRNQFISILIIVAVVLAVVVGWGIRELKKSQDAERIKNALNSQVEPAFPMPSEIDPATIVDSSSMEITDVPDSKPVLPAPVAKQEMPAAKPSQPEARPTPAPKETQPKPTAITKTMEPKPVASKPPEEKAEPEAVKKVEVPPANPKPEVIAKVEPPVKSPAATQTPAVTPKPQPTPEKTEAKPIPPSPSEVAALTPTPEAKAKTSTPSKAFAPEDMPLPSKVEASEESALAANTSKVEPAASDAPATASESFKTGMAAYRQADYVNAIRAFASLPKPVSRQRGNRERDEYVQGNFLRGVALLKMQHISEATTAFQTTLEYEKYYPLANMNLGICYLELKQYAKAHKSFEAVIRDQNFIEPAMFDDVMQRTKYFWALAWTRLYKGAKDPDKQNYYRQQAILRWKDYQVWFGKDDKFKSENQKADNYLKSLAAL